MTASLVMLLATIVLGAQAATGTISGLVTDETGARRDLGSHHRRRRTPDDRFEERADRRPDTRGLLARLIDFASPRQR
jgi:hypothetical protein